MKNDFIKKPLNPDGTLGLDQFNQMMAVVYYDDARGYSASPVANLFGHTCYICGHYFEPTAAEFKSAVHLQGVGAPVHARCFRQHQNINEESAVSDMICDCRKVADYGGFKLTPFPNNYPGSGGVDGYTVTFVDYSPEVRIHWRKRVREIVLTGRTVTSEEFKASKISQAGTHAHAQDRVLVHAWDDAEARTYLGEMVGWVCRPEYLVPFGVFDDYGGFWHEPSAGLAAARAFEIWKERGEKHIVTFHRGGRRIASPHQTPQEVRALCEFLQTAPTRE